MGGSGLYGPCLSLALCMVSRLLFLAEAGVRELRAAIVRVVWSRRQSLANPGAVLSLLDGPTWCDPAFCVVWFRSRMLRRFLAYRPGEVPSVYRLLEHDADGCPGHGPAHLLVESAAEIGFVWSPDLVGRVRDGLPVLSIVAGPIQHFGSAVLEGWRSKVSADLCARKGSSWESLVRYRWYLAAP